MDRYKVLIIIPNLGRGGAQRVFHQQLEYFSGFADVVGCVFNWDGAFESDRKASIISLDVPAGGSFFGKVYCFWRRCSELRRIKRKYGIQVSISHLEGADYVNILSRRSERIISWIHGTKKFDDNIAGVIGWFRRKVLIPLLYKKSNLLVTVSEGIRRELIQDYDIAGDQIKFIPNGFDLEQIQQMAGKPIDNKLSVPRFLHGENLLATHCRLSRQKNLHAMLGIFAKVRSDVQAKLIVLGDGELRDELFLYSISLGLQTFGFWKQQDIEKDFDVYFLGHFDNPYPVLTRSDMFLMTSSWEGFPLALCEAMACGIPVMATDCFTGPREVIAPAIPDTQPVKKAVISQDGILMPLADSSEAIQYWSDTIKMILEDDMLRKQFGTAGPKRVRDFDIKKIQREWLELVK